MNKFLKQFNYKLKKFNKNIKYSIKILRNIRKKKYLNMFSKFLKILKHYEIVWNKFEKILKNFEKIYLQI